jgi:hypothetical protein
VSIPPLRKRPAYVAIAEHHAKIEGRHMRELFAEEPVSPGSSSTGATSKVEEGVRANVSQ